MELTIGDKNYILNFGLGFLAKLDEMYTTKMEGVEFGVGMDLVIPYMYSENPVVLMNIIKAATDHLNSKPSNNDIELFLLEKAENDNLSNFFNEMKEAMAQAPFLKQKFKEANQEIEKIEER